MIKSMSPRLEKVMIDAEKIAFERGSESIQTESVLLALMYETGGTAHEALMMLGVKANALLEVCDKIAPKQPTTKPCCCCDGTGKVKR